MSVHPTGGIEDLIRRTVAAGLSLGAAEVVEEALRGPDGRDGLARLKAAITVGDTQLRQGEGIVYTSALLDEIERESKEAYRRGDQSSPDVCPASTASCIE